MQYPGTNVLVGRRDSQMFDELLPSRQIPMSSAQSINLSVWEHAKWDMECPVV